MKKNNSLHIGKAVYEVLKDKIQIYPVIADKSASYPFAVYRRTSISTQNTKDIYNFTEWPVLQIVIASKDYDESVALADLVKDSLVHKRGVSNNVHIEDCLLIDSSENWNNDAFIQELVFRFKIATK